jgi:DNA oxidative demethylase
MPPEPAALLLSLEDGGRTAREVFADRGVLLAGFALPAAASLMDSVQQITSRSPLRHMMTPGGWSMSVAMTNCGSVGWVTDRAGYRYDPIDPQNGNRWPSMSPEFSTLAALAADTAGFSNFVPDACLINQYAPGARMSLHQDKDERDFAQPIVSVSLGLPAVFLWGGLQRSDRPRRLSVFHGDVVVWGGAARKTYHGVRPLPDGRHALTGGFRYNLTFRKAL